MRTLVCFVLLWLLFGCTTRYRHWPYRGPLICIENLTSDTLTVVATRPDGAALELARHMKPQSRATARWPWIHAAGQLVAGPYGSGWYEPWSADTWRWQIGRSLSAGLCP